MPLYALAELSVDDYPHRLTLPATDVLNLPEWAETGVAFMRDDLMDWLVENFGYPANSEIEPEPLWAWNLEPHGAPDAYIHFREQQHAALTRLFFG